MEDDRAAPGSTAADALDRGNVVQHGLDEHGIVAVRAGDLHMQREPVAVSQDVVLGAEFPAVRGVGSSEIAPFFARTLTASRHVLDQSIIPA